MTIYNIINIGKNLYYNHTYLALTIIAGITVLIVLNPKPAFKIFCAVLVFLLVIYSFKILGHTSLTGVNNEKQMVNQTVNKTK